jgi:hypothetical protein
MKESKPLTNCYRHLGVSFLRESELLQIQAFQTSEERTECGPNRRKGCLFKRNLLSLAYPLPIRGGLLAYFLGNQGVNNSSLLP